VTVGTSIALLGSFIDNKLYESQSFSDFIQEIAPSAIDNFRPIDYYKSIHYLFLFAEKQNKNLFSGKKFYPNDPFKDVVENFDDDLPF
jgi:hypothetical protein